MIEARRRCLDDERSYFESDWKPDNWPASYRFLFVRRKVRRQIKGPLQLDLFEPRALDHEYRVLVTNKTGLASGDAPLSLRPRCSGRDFCRGQAAGRAGPDPDPASGRPPDGHLGGDDDPQPRTPSADARHNPRTRYSRAQRPAAWTFQSLATLRHRLIEPKGEKEPVSCSRSAQTSSLISAHLELIYATLGFTDQKKDIANGIIAVWLVEPTTIAISQNKEEAATILSKGCDLRKFLLGA